MRLVVTAGFDRALHAVALAEGLVRGGHTVAAILVVTPFDPARVRALVRQRGAGGLRAAIGRVLGGAVVSRDEDEMLAWAQARGVADRSLASLSRRHGIPRTVVDSLNSDRAVEALRRARADRVIYAGGGILKPRFLRASGEGVLNAHSGPLPEIRGINACEWSLLLGVRTAVTIHLIDEGIDTGPRIEEIPMPVRPGDTIARLRSRCTVLGVEGLLRAAGGPWPLRAPEQAGAPPNRQCFFMAPVLREIVEARLATAVRAHTDTA